MLGSRHDQETHHETTRDSEPERRCSVCRPPAPKARRCPIRRCWNATPETYWKRIRDEQFLLPDWRAFMNNGSLGITPRPVLKAVIDYLSQAAALLNDDYPRWGYETLDDEREELAAFVGCAKDELALTHNATEAMCVIANGIDLKAGDEVLITDQEHPSGREPWLLEQARYGIQVREVNIPLPPKIPRSSPTC